jgi:hypothetical protein
VVALDPIHDYAIAQRIEQISKEVLQGRQGSLYPALHRLENRGWLKSEWRNTDTGGESEADFAGPKTVEAHKQELEQELEKELRFHFVPSLAGVARSASE